MACLNSLRIFTLSDRSTSSSSFKIVAHPLGDVLGGLGVGVLADEDVPGRVHHLRGAKLIGPRLHQDCQT